ncbi:MAG: DNA primase, partial [Clostridia bacterium]|nr:DNA primase [Clostridia bacterium]
MRFDSGFIEELKARNDIVDVIGSYVTLKRAGSNHQGLCPFHNEKSPSFTVFSKSDSFYCFGCGAGGDVITFIMRVENLDYMSAIEHLAKRAGLSMPVGANAEKEINMRKRILEMNKEAAVFFRKAFKSGKYPKAMQYAEKRALDGPLGTHFGIGYCPDEYGALANHLRQCGYTADEMKAAFLCAEGKNKKLFDYYRGRLIFPIIDPAGNVVAFGGRALGDEKPKYLNTNDTDAFRKGRNIFALNFAKNSKEDHFILCEGYTDVIALHGAGFTNAVAGLGTAFTPEQANLLKKYKEKVIICYDGDEAGRKAT